MEPTHTLDVGSKDVPPDFRSGLKRPIETTHFSFDENHKFRPDRSQLKYYYTPEIGANLSDGFADFRKLDDSGDTHLLGLLEAIMVFEEQQGKKMDADVICFRGLMTKVMTMPYESDPFEFNAITFQDTIFLELDHAFTQQSKRAQDAQQNHSAHAPNPEMSSYWGYKFETLSLLDDTWDNTPRSVIESRVLAPVSNYEQYCSIVQTGIHDIKMILAGEVDGIWDDIPAPSTQSTSTPTELRPNYVELKTSLRPDNSPQSQQRFERKLNRHWAQSYLLGVPKIVFGYRNRGKTPRLQNVDVLETKDIPSMVQANHRSWEMRPCVYALAQFLGFLKHNMAGKSGVWKVRREGSRITLHQTAAEGVGDILTPEFLEWRSKSATQDSEKPVAHDGQ